MHARAKLGVCATPVFALAAIFVVSTTSLSFAQSTAPASVAPPRTIAEITAILDQQKPDAKLLAERRAAADTEPPTSASRAVLANFYFERGHARADLGRYREAIADGEKAVEIARGFVEPNQLALLLQFVAIQYQAAGDLTKALELLKQHERDIDQPGSKGRLLQIYQQIVKVLIGLGDFNQAEAYAKKADAHMQWAYRTPIYADFRMPWTRHLERINARLLEGRGQFREAEIAYRRLQDLERESVDIRLKLPYPQTRVQLERGLDRAIADEGRMKARQGRLAEGEFDVRRALLSRLKVVGKYNADTVEYIDVLSKLLVEQGRYAEAEKLARTSIEILQTLGYAGDAQLVASSLNDLASILGLQNRWAEAAQIHAAVEAATKGWEQTRKERLTLNTEHIYTLYKSGNIAAGIAAAAQLLSNQIERYGEQNGQTALTRGLLAIGYAQIGRAADAVREFRLAIPLLISGTRETDQDEALTIAAREQRLQVIVEAYIALLARSPHLADSDPLGESFRLADAIRGRSVQRALAASSARAAAGDPALADLARKVQDLERRVAAQLGVLNNVLALPPEQRDDNVVRVLQGEIETLRAARDAEKIEISSRFPAYSALIEPAPATVAEVKTALRPDEAFVSFYFGRERGFVWAVTNTGPLAFSIIDVSAAEIEKKVQALRRALEPQASTISDIPPFDVALANELYALLLKPVEQGWKPAKSLIVATNGALGLLPLGLLVTEPVQIAHGSKPYFAEYRDVPWLARTHAASLVPSASALLTLRQLPAVAKTRDLMIGFGDPIFSKEQAEEAEDTTTPIVQASLRGVPLHLRAAPQTTGVDSAELALLPRLPDTADELKAIAAALQADPAKVLNLGKAANEETVKNADLSNYRIIVFATHGLVPGDLNGLTQPALALTAPEVAGVPGDGLLTMEEILAFKLDADWVVLSACNTGAGAAAGAEAASGLGRAFFYAGTRAILVTNWSVHSASARELVTDLFRRQAQNAQLTRAQALREAMTALLDGPGFTNAKGETVFAYAHPLFWAPYMIIGDGGGESPAR